VAANILLMVTLMLTSQAIIREKEIGTIPTSIPRIASMVAALSGAATKRETVSYINGDESTMTLFSMSVLYPPKTIMV
jgi:hypothetical protein